MVEPEAQAMDLGDLLTFDPHWFRRAVHALGATFVLYYALPDAVPWVLALKTWGPWVVLAVVLVVEAARMAGWIASEHFFGLREYERTRVSGYVYFAIASALLLVGYPEAIAVPCLIGAGIGDPVMGELRRLGHRAGSLAGGALLSLVLFALAGWTPLAIVLGAGLMVLGESTRFRLLDDDLLMPLLPATVLWGLAWAGVVPLPPDVIPQLGVPP